PPSPLSTLFPYTTLFRSAHEMRAWPVVSEVRRLLIASYELLRNGLVGDRSQQLAAALAACSGRQPTILAARGMRVDLISGAPLQSEGIGLNADRKSTRLNSSHVKRSY